MNTRIPPKKISFALAILALFALLIYLVGVAPSTPITDLRGLLVFAPSILGAFGLIAALAARAEAKKMTTTVLIGVHLLFLLWVPIFWYGGTLLFGV